MNKKEILDRLQEHYEYAIQCGYDEEHILGVFLYGSQNYGTANADSDIDSKLILLPSFEQLCLSPEMVSKELHYKDEHIEVKDIRLMRQMWMKQNINFIEILFTEYYILNPKYEKLFNQYFVENRETIAHFDRNKTLVSISSQLLNTLDQGMGDNKKLYNSWRLYYFLEKYIAGEPYEKCLKPIGKELAFLMSLRNNANDMCFDKEKAVVSGYDLKYKTRKLVEDNNNLDSPEHEAATAVLNQGVIEILKQSFVEDLSQSTMSKADFMKQLTNAEERAYYSIVKNIGAEGNITISKLVEQNSISRPVYNNLINKMKEHNIAKVSNQGVKGTYIKITQPELKAEAIDF